jgi:hypothetical protein
MRNVAGSQQRMKAYLTSLGLKEGDLHGSNDFGIEYGDKTHLRTQFSKEGAARYMKAIGGGGESKHMNDSSLFQMDKGTHIRISNPAGASVHTQTAMLGAIKSAYS